MSRVDDGHLQVGQNGHAAPVGRRIGFGEIVDEVPVHDPSSLRRPSQMRSPIQGSIAAAFGSDVGTTPDGLDPVADG